MAQHAIFFGRHYLAPAKNLERTEGPFARDRRTKCSTMSISAQRRPFACRA
jgi:hypothetical protein